MYPMFHWEDSISCFMQYIIAQYICLLRPPAKREKLNTLIAKNFGAKNFVFLISVGFLEISVKIHKIFR